MKTFLNEIASHILNKHANELEKITIVFNNRRSGVFLKEEIKKQVSKTTFLPNIIGIDELVSNLSNLQIIPNEFLLFELYNIHCKLYKEKQEKAPSNCTDDKGKECETFEEFMSLGDMMISDFSEIDMYRVDAQSIFNNLHDLKQIGEWNIEGGGKTNFQKDYLYFYQSLYEYYTQLHEQLKSLGMAYSGMAYRYVAENIESLISKHKSSYFYFVGFNALSKCEETIITSYIANGIGEIITDGDSYYFDDEQQEAGFFLRKHKEIFNQKYTDHFIQQDKSITIVSCPENILQAKYVGQILTTLNQKEKENKMEQTAIVLSDENLLIPTLNSLPKEVSSANISMGFPFTNTNVHTLILKLFSLYNRVRNQGFYHQDILDILSDFHIHNMLKVKDIWENLSKKLSNDNIIYANLEQLKSIAQTLKIDFNKIEFLFANLAPTPDQFLEILRTLTINLYSSSIIKKADPQDPKSTPEYNINAREVEALGCSLEIVNYFINLQKKYQFIQNLSTLEKIYTKLAQRRTISFYGNSISGLQILGVLETRNLDFDTVIMLSVNEGMIPSGRGNNTLIPLQLKYHFGIPTYREKDAVYAYHFYRFLQRAKNIYLIYHTESEDSFSKGEPSRFIMQVEEELAKKYKQKIHIDKVELSVKSSKLQDSVLPIGYKTPDVLKKLKEKSISGFAPSYLIDYKNCPLQFYYKHILKINEEDNLDEEISQSELGSYIHEILKNIYDNFIDKEISAEDLTNIKKDLDNRLSNSFKNKTFTEGPNYLLKSIAKEQISNLLDKEINAIHNHHTLQIVMLEQDLSTKLTLPELNTEVTIHGIVDRIDYFDKCLRIIDYKTGKVSPSDLKRSKTGIPDKLFQVMTYLWLYYQNNKDNIQQPIHSGIYPLQNFKEYVLLGKWGNDENITINDINDFEQELTTIVQEIMDPNTHFLPNNKDKNTCLYCPMKSVCNKS